MGIYHGIKKKYIAEYADEYEWRFNHRNKGVKFMLPLMRILSYQITMIRNDLKRRYSLSSGSDGL